MKQIRRDYTEIVREIKGILEDLGNPARAEKAAWYAPSRMRMLGVSTPEIRAVIREIRTRYRDLDGREWIGLCKALVDTGIFECQGLAFELIGRNRKLLDALVYEDLAGLGKNLDNWASADLYSVGIYGVLWRKGVVRDRHLDRLLRSVNPWDRRVAVVSTVALNLKSRGGTGDTQRTLSVCERVVDERHEVIQKALSWALRELSKRDRDAVQDFLDTHRHRLAPRVLREVSHKLDFGTKN
jgi:3-methyladenine DNA glycosylase AlkD